MTIEASKRIIRASYWKPGKIGGITMKFRRFALLALLFVLICSTTSFAAIIIEQRTGAVKIFMPDGKQLVIQSDQPLPAIPDGATVTIVAGSAVIHTTGKSTVSVSIGTYTIELKESSKVMLSLNPDGTVNSTIIAGQAMVTRKVEAYESPIPPAASELGPVGGGETGRDISPSQ